MANTANHHQGSLFETNPNPGEVLFREQTMYQQCEFRLHPLYGVQLYLDNDLQVSEVDTAYNSAIVSPLLCVPQVRKVAILGGGDGGVLGELLHATANRTVGESPHITLIDIDGAVVKECADRLSPFNRGALSQAPGNVAVIIGDAFEYIRTAGELDVVIYDLTMDPIREDQPLEEFAEEILTLIHASLRRGGILSMQCGASAAVEDSSHPHARVLAEIHRVASSIFATVTYQDVLVPSYEEKWRFLAAVKGE